MNEPAVCGGREKLEDGWFHSVEIVWCHLVVRVVCCTAEYCCPMLDCFCALGRASTNYSFECSHEKLLLRSLNDRSLYIMDKIVWILRVRSLYHSHGEVVEPVLGVDV